MAAVTVPPARLSQELREGSSPDLARRRAAIALSFTGILIGKVVADYQPGLIKRLPDVLPGRIFDAEKVDASDYAYKRMQVPDALLMVLTYASTAALAAAGGKDRARENPKLPIIAAAKAGYDVTTAFRLAREEWGDNKALCSWCQIGTLVSAATFALAIPEALRAIGTLRGGGNGMAAGAA